VNFAFRHVLAICRSIAFCLLTAFFYLLWLVFTPFLLASERASYRWRSVNFRRWARATATLLRMRVTVKGTAPRAPFFLVSNHLSYIDVITFASQLDAVFVAKSDVAGWPFLGIVCRSMGTIFVNRASQKDVVRVNALIGRALTESKGVLLFPEGTSTAGDEILPFHSALLEPCVVAGCPVSFAAIHYQTPTYRSSARCSVCWWGDMRFLPHLYRLFQLHSFEATLAFGSHALRADDRKTLARELQRAVSAKFLEARNPVVIDRVNLGARNEYQTIHRSLEKMVGVTSQISPAVNEDSSSTGRC
jgi:1-acyl-sn-glycerol-3-phosphate acyltransferase